MFYDSIIIRLECFSESSLLVCDLHKHFSGFFFYCIFSLLDEKGSLWEQGAKIVYFPLVCSLTSFLALFATKISQESYMRLEPKKSFPSCADISNGLQNRLLL